MTTHARAQQAMIERDIIGSVVTDPRIYAGIRALRPDDFLVAHHAQIWRAIEECVSQGLPVTPQRLEASLIDPDAGKLADILAAATANHDAVTRNAHALIDQNRRRWLASILRNGLDLIENGDVPWTDIAEQVTDSLNGHRGLGLAVPAADVERKLRDRLASDKTRHIPTGIAPLDDYLGGGLPNSSLVIVGALGKTGKTTLAASISFNFEEQQIPHLFFSLERRDDDIERLKLARLLNINARHLNAAVARTAPRRQRYVSYIHETRLDISRLRHEILFQARTNGIKAAIIDYLQLIGGERKGERAVDHKARVAQELQRTAVDADIPIFLTCQTAENNGHRDWEAAKTAGSAFFILHREQASSFAYLETVTSNIGDEVDIGSNFVPSLFLDSCGPHFRAQGGMGA